MSTFAPSWKKPIFSFYIFTLPLVFYTIGMEMKKGITLKYLLENVYKNQRGGIHHG